MSDRFGFGWRRELGMSICMRAGEIGVLEVIAEHLIGAPASRLEEIRSIARRVPVVVHSVTLGLASSVPVADERLEKVAQVVNLIEPLFWSDHLAFVRGGGVEIGHLTPPPRNAATLAGTAANVRRAAAVVGSLPLLENIATLFDAPLSTMSEIEWINEVLAACGTRMLLDLHNLYANSLNFRYCGHEFLRQLPIDRVAAVHLAGGAWHSAPHGGPAARAEAGGVASEAAMGGTRYVDTHAHAVPDPVYALLETLGELNPGPLMVVLERDRHLTSVRDLLAELEPAKAALASGRGRALGGRGADRHEGGPVRAVMTV